MKWARVLPLCMWPYVHGVPLASYICLASEGTPSKLHRLADEAQVELYFSFLGLLRSCFLPPTLARKGKRCCAEECALKRTSFSFGGMRKDSA